jgi:hypothetical protein
MGDASQQRARFLPILVGEPTGFERLPGAPQSSPELRASHGIALDELEQESARSKPRR